MGCVLLTSRFVASPAAEIGFIPVPPGAAPCALLMTFRPRASQCPLSSHAHPWSGGRRVSGIETARVLASLARVSAVETIKGKLPKQHPPREAGIQEDRNICEPRFTPHWPASSLSSPPPRRRGEPARQPPATRVERPSLTRRSSRS